MGTHTCPDLLLEHSKENLLMYCSVQVQDTSKPENLSILHSLSCISTCCCHYTESKTSFSRNYMHRFPFTRKKQG